ncbi:hypothetical protein [Dactylosporangium cerinum]
MVLSLAAVTAFAVLVSQLVLLSTPAYAASDLALTGPLVRPGDDPLDAIRTVLTQQSEALLRGDRAGYLQAIPADRQDLRAEAGRRFDSLTALDVRRWDLTATTSPERDGDGWRQVVGIGYCFAADDCLPVELRIGTQWSVARGRLQLIGYEQTTRPWDTGTLTAKRGARVTVAGPADDAQVSPRPWTWCWVRRRRSPRPTTGSPPRSTARRSGTSSTSPATRSGSAGTTTPAPPTPPPTPCRCNRARPT